MRSKAHRRRLVAVPMAATAAAVAVALAPPFGGASSHREAPSISQDPTADNTDVYAFRSPDAPDTATLIANFVPFQEPAGGPNFYRFSDDVTLPFAAELCERAVVLAAGRVVADGPAEEVLADAGLLAAHDLELPAGVDLDRIERRPRPGGGRGAAAGARA